MPRVAGPADHETALMKSLYDEHAAVLLRFVLHLTGDASRAEDVVQETLLRAWQHPDVVGDTGRSPQHLGAGCRVREDQLRAARR